MHYLSVNMNNVIFNFKRQFPRMCPIGDPNPPSNMCNIRTYILSRYFFHKAHNSPTKNFWAKVLTLLWLAGVQHKLTKPKTIFPAPRLLWTTIAQSN